MKTRIFNKVKGLVKVLPFYLLPFYLYSWHVRLILTVWVQST